MVFPVYFWGLPEIIKRFSKMPEIRNALGNYVYCVKDKNTFSTAGFTSTGNIGIQYIKG